MVRLIQRFNWGSEVKNINETLYNQLNDSFYIISQAMFSKTTKAPMNSDPSSSSQANIGYDVGDVWINQSSNKAWIMTSRSTKTNVTWTLIT